MKRINLIHIGKCSGGTISNILRKNFKEDFKIFHTIKPKEYNHDELYIICIRCPVMRAISAFNWILNQSEHQETLEQYEKYGCINNLAESLDINKDSEYKTADTFIKKYGDHLKMDINFYLEDFLHKFTNNEPIDNIYIIRQEYIEEDLKKLKISMKKYNINLNFDLEKDSSKFFKKKNVKLSKNEYNNLVNYYKKDYKCLEKLIEINLLNYDYIKQTKNKLFIDEINNNDNIDISIDINNFYIKKNLIITFGGMVHNLSEPVYEFKRFLNNSFNEEIHFIFIKDSFQTWYLNGIKGTCTDKENSKIDESVEFLKNIINKINYNKIATIGSSAGGYASILFGILLKVDSILSFSPQIFIDTDNRKSLFDKRWGNSFDLGLLNKRYCIYSEKYFDLSKLKNNINSIIIVVGLRDLDDIIHSRKLLKYDNVKIYECISGHSNVKKLMSNNYLSIIINKLFNKDIHNEPKIQLLELNDDWIGIKRAA